MSCLAKGVMTVVKALCRLLLRLFRRSTCEVKTDSLLKPDAHPTPTSASRTYTGNQSGELRPRAWNSTVRVSDESVHRSSHCHWRDSGISCSPTTEDEVFFQDVHSPVSALYETEINKLRNENTSLKEKLGHSYLKFLSAAHAPRPESRWRMCYSWPDPQERSPASKSRSHSGNDVDACQRGQQQPRRSMDRLVQEQLLKKLTSVEEENRRLKEFVNDVMYMLLDCSPTLLEK